MFWTRVQPWRWTHRDSSNFFHILRLTRLSTESCSGFRLEPRLLQQYASMQHQSPMASVRIPPPAHDSGGLYNPFNAGPLGPPPPRDVHQQVRAATT